MTADPALITRLRGLEADHGPDGWPAIQMRDVTALLQALGALTALQTVRAEDRAALATLTPRELEVLQLSATGLTNREISVRLGIQHYTVLDHRRKIHAKLGVATIIEAAVMAARVGLA